MIDQTGSFHQPPLHQPPLHQAPFCQPSFREGPAGWRPAGALDEAPAFGRRVWLITFTDLVSLMLAFFVMLFAMSGVNVELWDVTSESFTRTLNPSRPPTPPPPVAARNVPMVVRAPALDLDYLAALFRRIRQSSPELVETRLTRLPEGLILALRPGDVFEGEGVALSPAAAKTFSAVGGALGNFSNRISVRLRADSARMLEAGYPSAWERALVRAAAVANALRAAGYDREIAAYGSTDGGSSAFGEPTEDEWIEIVILAELVTGS
jgi:chemotaxis protein MotB